MTTDDSYHQLTDLLLMLEAELRRLHVWEDQQPSATSLMSVQPFCIDTLRFTQWLQFVMIPRFKMMIDTQQALPLVCDISSYAEEALQDVSFSTRELLDLLTKLDQVMAPP